MIGVIADAADHDVVREFFELFKTPWEFFREGGLYDAVLLNGENCQAPARASLVVAYAGGKSKFDEEQRIPTSSICHSPCILAYEADRLPIYGKIVELEHRGTPLLTRHGSGERVAFFDEQDGKRVARIGYDLFSEVRTLLTGGQPVANARIPALELHIAFLRDLLIRCGVPLVEIPPVPDGFSFIACLTHDVDHPSIRQHKLDHTMFGFLFRACFGSLRRLVSGQISLRDTFTNWLAVVKLPFVYLGVAKDFWRDFADRYSEIEQELRSTFFVIPYKNHPGMTSQGTAPSFRTSGYAADDISDIIKDLMAGGHEVGLHGIDAWTDSARGSAELQGIRKLTGAAETGVRMHWLYFDHNSPATLEKAGVFYDSTVGYNETVGYRAGTTQVYRPLGTTKLLELPLHVMDTALFYPSRLELTPGDAAAVLEQMQNSGARLGGVLTINWHDRSLAPERLWSATYRNLLADLKSRGAWITTAGQAVAWFRKRRAATFVLDSEGPRTVVIKISGEEDAQVPALRLRKHRSLPALGDSDHFDFVDIPVSRQLEAVERPEMMT